MSGNICAMYFSPTRTTKTITGKIAEILSQETGKASIEADLTRPCGRGGEFSYGSGDILLLGFPVYGGRIPRVLEETLSKLKGDDTAAVIVAVYGNRDYDDALVEAEDILKAGGFTVTAAGAFIGEHSFSRKLAACRPDKADLDAAADFALRIAGKLASGNLRTAAVKGARPYRERMQPLPFLPKTNESCTGCMVCAESCPMEIISGLDPKTVAAGCIQCNHCVKACPVSAKYFDDEPLMKSIAMLEGNFMARKEPEFFL